MKFLLIKTNSYEQYNKTKKIRMLKLYGDIIHKDEYAYVDQADILEVLKDPTKVIPEVKNI